MTKIMTPSVQPMTDEQIDKAVATYRAILCKHRSGLGSDAVQHVLGQPEYVEEQVAVLKKRVEAVSEMIVRRVKVNRFRSSQEALDATGRRQYCDPAVVVAMPVGEGEEVDLYFFPNKRRLSDAELEEEFDWHGLKPDPRAQIAANEADPSLADDYPNATHWKDADDNWCYAAFGRWCSDEPIVHVIRRGDELEGGGWFAGVPK
jgi:hypothetical protein